MVFCKTQPYLFRPVTRIERNSNYLWSPPSAHSFALIKTNPTLHDHREQPVLCPASTPLSHPPSHQYLPSASTWPHFMSLIVSSLIFFSDGNVRSFTPAPFYLFKLYSNTLDSIRSTVGYSSNTSANLFTK